MLLHCSAFCSVRNEASLPTIPTAPCQGSPNPNSAARHKALLADIAPRPAPCRMGNAARAGVPRVPARSRGTGFITHHNTTSREPRQVTEQLARILSRQNFQAPHAAGRTWQCPQAPAPSRSSRSPPALPQSDSLQGPSDVGSNTSAGGGRTFYSFPSHALQNPAEDSTQSAGQSPLPDPCPRARRVRRPPELLSRCAAPRSSASATASP